MNERPVLDALRAPLQALAAAAVADGGPQTRAASRRVIAIYEAGTGSVAGERD